MTRARDLADGKHLTNVDSNTLVVDATNNRVGVGGTSPSQKFVVTNAGADNIVMAENSSASIQMFMQAQSGVGAVGTLTNHATVFLANNGEKGRFLSGGGLTFNGDTAAANALSDYEEGSWTGTLIGTTSNPSTSVTATGYYVKIGEKVSCTIQFTNVNTTGAAGSVRVNGLPFTGNRIWVSGNAMFYSRFNINSATGNIAPYHPGDQQVSFYQSSNGAGWTEVTHSAGTGAFLWFTVEYAVSLS